MPINGYLGGVISATAPSVTTAGASGIFTLEEQLQASAQNNWPGYQISRSVRLRSSASAYFNRTLTTPTNNKIWTFSCWFKRGQLTYGASGASGALFYAPSSGSTFAGIYFTPSDLLLWYDASGGSTVYLLQPAQVFRDPSAWYHIVCAYDSTQATDTNRQKIYINGVLVTTFASGGSTYVAQNTNGRFNSAVAHDLGKTSAAGPYYFDGYMTEINFIDGQALTPTSFGATDAVTGVWNPIRYSGTYGTNGFYLNFSDPTSTTTIGYDYSGNSNNWTANNISVTAGTTYDSMVDVPIGYGGDTGVGGEVRGNYCTLNPVDNGNSNILLTNGNISVSSSTTWDRGVKGTFGVSSGKWYYEYIHGTVNAGTNPAADIGWTKYIGLVNSATNGGGSSSDTYLVQGSNGNKNNGGTNTSYGSAFTTGDIEMCAIDLDNGKMYWGKNGTWFNSGDPAAGINAAYTGLSGTFLPLWYWGLSPGTSGVLISNINFGQRAFSYTAPSGFKALCTQNLSVPTILNGANYMAASLYTGTGASQTVSNAVNSISFQPDLVWIKSRSNAQDHKWTDVVRGVTKALISNSAAAQTTDTNGLTAFGSTGFTIGSDATYNTNTYTYVGWQWKAGGTSVSNSTGTKTVQLSANATCGFSIATMTQTTGTFTTGHGLGVAPKFVITKDISAANGWICYHYGLNPTAPQNYYISLNGSGAYASGTAAGGIWQGTQPSSSVIYFGDTATWWGASGVTRLIYAFAPISGFSNFGSYTGNGSADGPFIYCGFRPRFVLIRRFDTTGDWFVWDTSRDPYNAAYHELYVEVPNAEVTSMNSLDINSNGFKLRTTSPDRNGNGNLFIYAAFAENPFNISRAR